MQINRYVTLCIFHVPFSTLDLRTKNMYKPLVEVTYDLSKEASHHNPPRAWHMEKT